MIDEATETLLAKWYGRLEPRPLDIGKSEEDRALYVDLDAWSGATAQRRALRGPAAIDLILDTIRLEAQQTTAASTHLFAGFPGTGKTTELGRLAKALREEKRAPGFSVLRVSAKRYHPLDKALSMEEMAILLAAGIGEAALETLGETALPELQKKEGIWEAIHGRLAQAMGKQAITFKLGVVELKPALFGGGTSLRDQLRNTLGEKARDKLQDLLHGMVEEIALAIQPRQLVVIVDDLEKYTVATPKVAEVYQEMADLFFHNVATFKLPYCHTVYTVPPYLTFLNQGIEGVFDNLVYRLPSVKIHGRPPGRGRDADGITALTQMLSARVDLDRLFGTDRDACMELIAIASGGHLRDLANLMKSMVRAAMRRPMPFSPRDVDEVITQYGATRTLLKNNLDVLLEVSEHGDLRAIGAKDLGACATAMDAQLILCYWNGAFWYDAHPIIAERVEQERAQRARQGSPDGRGEHG